MFTPTRFNSAIDEFDPNGNFITTFVAGCAGTPACDPLDKAVVPSDITFGPDGNLYVLAQGDGGTGYVNRYDSTGTFIDRFVPTGFGPVGGLQYPGGLTFGPDGNLYVSDEQGIYRFAGSNGDYTLFLALGNPPTPISVPLGLVFGPDGHLYVA